MKRVLAEVKLWNNIQGKIMCAKIASEYVVFEKQEEQTKP